LLFASHSRRRRRRCYIVHYTDFDYY
jgi:hypothetical protein